MSSSVLDLLEATRTSDSTVRGNAEEQIKTFVLTHANEFLTALLRTAGDAEVSVANGQSALLVLKNCIVTYWSPGFEQFQGPPFKHETRELVRKGLFELLVLAPNLKVRTACALVVARIGSLEYPDQWPDLVDRTVALLSTAPDSDDAYAGVALFKELLYETLREEDFMNIGEYVLLKLLDIAKVPSQDGRRLLAIQSFHECITFLLMGDDDQLPELESVATRFIPQWIELFCSLFIQGIEARSEDTELFTEIVLTTKEIDSAFPQVLVPSLPHLFTVVWEFLEQNVGSDDELKSNLAYLLEICLQSADVRRQCLGSGPQINRFSRLLLQLAIVSEELAEWWHDDYNEFLTVELELDASELSPRQNAAQLVALTGQPAILSCLLNMLDPANLPVLEAVLFLLSSLLSQIDLDKHLGVLDFSLFQHFLNALQLGSESIAPYSDIVVARKIITASVVAKYSGSYLPTDIKLQLATHAFSNAISQQPLIQTSKLIASKVAIALFPNEVRHFQTDMLKTIAGLISSAEGDTAVFLTECYGTILTLNYDVVTQESGAINILFELAGKNTADVDLNAQILDVVGELMDSVSSSVVVNHLLQPVLAAIEVGIRSNYEYSSDLYFSLDLATAVFEHEKVQMSESEREHMLQSFYGVITMTQDPQILQVSSFAYAALVQNIDTTISPEAATNVLKVAARLLDPALDDSAALASGKLVNAIIDQFGNDLGDSLAELIEASARRLAVAENALLVETLVLVFCELTLRNAQAVVDILSNANLLESVINQWIPTFEVVRGAEEIRKNVKALQLLFELNDSRLNSLMLPDEPIVEPNVILTRRKAKNLKFTQVALPLKIIKLLIRELAQAPKPPTNNEPQDGSDDDEWDDELAMNDEGEVLDYRSFNLIIDWFKKLGQQGMQWFSQLNSNERKILVEASRDE